MNLEEMDDQTLIEEEDRLLLALELDPHRHISLAAGRIAVGLLSVAGTVVALGLVARFAPHAAEGAPGLCVVFGVGGLGFFAGGSVWSAAGLPVRHAVRTAMHHWPACLVTLVWLWTLTR